MAYDTIEIYVRALPEAEAVDWLRDVFDGLEQVRDQPIVTYEGQYGDTSVPVQITEEVKGGVYTSLWFNAPDVPWDSARACAEAAHEALGKEVLCYLNDPERPWTLLRITESGTESVDKQKIAF